MKNYDPQNFFPAWYLVQILNIRYLKQCRLYDAVLLLNICRFPLWCLMSEILASSSRTLSHTYTHTNTFTHEHTHTNTQKCCTNMMDGHSGFDTNRKWHIRLFLPGLHILHYGSGRSATSGPPPDLCVSPHPCVFSVCVAINLYFEISESAACLSAKDIHSILLPSDDSPPETIRLWPHCRLGFSF